MKRTIFQQTLYVLSLYICSISANNIDTTSLPSLKAALELASELPKLSTTKIEAAQKIQKAYRQHNQLQKKLTKEASINALKMLIKENQDGEIMFSIEKQHEILDLLNKLDLEERIIFNENSNSHGFYVKELIQLLSNKELLLREEENRNRIILEEAQEMADFYNEKNFMLYN